MKILLEGCLYELESVHGTEIQAVKFITTTPSVDNPKKLIMINDGTTNEELIRVLIHRLEWQNRKLACMETQHAITELKDALRWLEQRCRARKDQDKENTLYHHKPIAIDRKIK
jgi:hypothetical protein